MKSVVLAEKPSVAKELARVLKCNQKTKGFFEGSQYIVTWALGHLVTLAEPGDIDQRYKEWKLDYLPMLPDKIGLKVIGKSSHQFRTISSLLARNDVREVIIATDAGREGELVARWILKKASCKKKFCRLWISSQTDQAIREGFAALKPGQDYNNLYASAVCRAEADWLVGLNVTRALACKFEAQLSAGRVQTPTLAMLVAREEEIKKFTPVDFWTIEADFGDFTGYFRDKNGNGRLFQFEKVDALLKKLADRQGTVKDVKVEEKQEPPPLAYDLTELQRDANRRFNLSAKQTLSIIQSLYERHKIVTYPRTDSRYITEDMVKTLPDRLKAINVSPYNHLIAPLLANMPVPGKRLVNNAKISDHHAIIPTEQHIDLSRLDADERRVHDLIVRRFIAVLSPPYRYTRITIVTEVAGELFHAQGREEKEAGWKHVQQPFRDEETADEEVLPEQRLKSHKVGEQLAVTGLRSKAAKTGPPARYTEATLLSAMENPSRFVAGKELKESLNQGGGLGTPATRADIIEKLIRSFYMERQNKFLVPTSKGSELIKLVPIELRSAELTARWELRLSEIAAGREPSRSFIDDIKKHTVTLVEEVKTSKAEYKPGNVSTTPCPLCGELMFNSGQKGAKMLICPNRSCGHKQGENQGDFYANDRGRRGRGRPNPLVKQYATHGEEKATFADLIKAAQERKKK